MLRPVPSTLASTIDQPDDWWPVRRLCALVIATVMAIAIAVVGVTMMSAPAEADPAWTPSTVPQPADFASGGFAAVQCPSAQFCVAVGSYTSTAIGSPALPLASTYDGTQWITASLPLPADFQTGEGLVSVACASATLCQAVGSYVTNGAGNPTRPLIETFNGAGWNLAASPAPPNLGGTAFFDSVACVSTTSCHAVGAYADTGGLVLPLIETFDGAVWSAVISPLPADYQSGARLNGITCVSSGLCQAVGSYVTLGAVARPLVVQTTDGVTWTASVTPDPADFLGGGVFRGVACGSASSCEAVGSYQGVDNLQHSLIESYDGSAWSAVTVPPPSDFADHAFLLSVSCSSATLCEAVGGYLDAASLEHTLTAVSDGTTWSLAPAADPSDFGNTALLSGVTCTTATWCVAVGSYQTNGAGTPPPMRGLVQIYDGTTWTLASLADPADLGSTAQLNGVSCATPAVCQAVGFYTDTAATNRPLIETNSPIPPRPTLAATGSDPALPLTFALLLTAIGAATLLERRRSRR